MSRGLNPDVMGSGQSLGTGQFYIYEMASPMGLATSKKVSRGLNPDVMGSGQSHGTGHFKKGVKGAES